MAELDGAVERCKPSGPVLLDGRALPQTVPFAGQPQSSDPGGEANERLTSMLAVESPPALVQVQETGTWRMGSARAAMVNRRCPGYVGDGPATYLRAHAPVDLFTVEKEPGIERTNFLPRRAADEHTCPEWVVHLDGPTVPGIESTVQLRPQQPSWPVKELQPGHQQRGVTKGCLLDRAIGEQESGADCRHRGV